MATIKTMEELLKKYGSKVKGFKRGQKVEARLLDLSKKTATFDIGGKSEGIINDIYFQEARDYLKTLKVGDIVTAVVINPEVADGNVLLSLRHAASDSLWEKFKRDLNKGTIVNVNVKNSNQSGILVDFEGISGFIPTSQIGKVMQQNLGNITGNTIKVKVIEVDKSKRKIVFSEKAVSEVKEMAEASKAFEAIKTGEIYKGAITTITTFGVFVEIVVKKNKLEGLVHISETSWDKANKPEDMFKIGQKVEVKVLGLHDGKLSLSIKQAEKDPWTDVANKFKVEDKLKGKVTRNSDFGTFVQIAPGIEGLIHITKIPPATKLGVGDELNVYIEEIDTRNKKISLGLVLSVKPVGYK